MFARGHSVLMALPSWKPQRMAGLLNRDRMCPRRFESKFAGGLLSGLLGRRFNHSAQWIAEQTGILPVDVIDAPELIALTWSHGRAHGRN